MIFLTQYADILGFNKLGKYKIVYVSLDELTENNPESYFKLMIYRLDGSRLNEEETAMAFISLKEKCKKSLEKFDKIIFILEGFSRIDYPLYFFNNLFNLWQSNKNKIQFIFPITRSMVNQKEIQKLGRLRELIIQDIIYSPLFSKADSKFSTEYLVRQYAYRVNEKQKNAIVDLCGGHPGLTKTCLKLISWSKFQTKKEIFDFLVSQWETKIVLEDIWKAFTREEKSFLYQIVTGNTPSKNLLSNYLENLKVVQFHSNKWTLFSPIFKNFVKNQKMEKKSLSMSEQTGEFLVNELPVKETVTLNEYRLLEALLKNKNQIITRDKISEILWGKDSYQKYSDWAIDQTISLLRKKLEKMGISPNSIQTIKGRGYRWLS